LSENQPPATEETPRDKFFRLFNEYLEAEMGRHSVAAAPGPLASPTAIPGLAAEYDKLDKDTKKAIDTFMEEMKPEIQKKATDLLTFEIRDKIARSGNINKIMEAMKKKKKISLKRKKGCIFLQLGSGEPNDQIDEFLIANTGG